MHPGVLPPWLLWGIFSSPARAGEAALPSQTLSWTQQSSTPAAVGIAGQQLQRRKRFTKVFKQKNKTRWMYACSDRQAGGVHSAPSRRSPFQAALLSSGRSCCQAAPLHLVGLGLSCSLKGTQREGKPRLLQCPQRCCRKSREQGWDAATAPQVHAVEVYLSLDPCLSPKQGEPGTRPAVPSAHSQPLGPGEHRMLQGSALI